MNRKLLASNSGWVIPVGAPLGSCSSSLKDGALLVSLLSFGQTRAWRPLSRSSEHSRHHLETVFQKWVLTAAFMLCTKCKARISSYSKCCQCLMCFIITGNGMYRSSFVVPARGTKEQIRSTPIVAKVIVNKQLNSLANTKKSYGEYYLYFLNFKKQ